MKTELTRLLLAGILLLASTALRVRLQHEREVNATPEEAFKTLKKVYGVYLDDENSAQLGQLTSALYDHFSEGFDASSFHTFLNKLGFKASQKFAEDAWNAVDRPDHPIFNDERTRFLKQTLDKAAWRYLVDSEFYKYDADSDSHISLEKFKKAVPGIKHWFEKDFFSEDAAESYEYFQRNGELVLWNWRRMFEYSVRSTRAFVQQRD